MANNLEISFGMQAHHTRMYRAFGTPCTLIRFGGGLLWDSVVRCRWSQRCLCLVFATCESQ